MEGNLIFHLLGEPLTDAGGTGEAETELPPSRLERTLKAQAFLGNFTKNLAKMQFAYPKAPRSGAFAYVFCIFAEFFVKFVGNAENSQNYNLGPKA